MPMCAKKKVLSVAALCSGIFLGSMIAATQSQADTEDDAIGARQGFMRLVSWNAGPLFGMAKGNVAYDAETAAVHAANLKTLYQYPYPALFVPGTSKVDRPGKTRALPEIWSDNDKFGQAFDALVAAVAVVAEEAGTGQAELAAAVGEMGKACGGCHNAFRAKEF